MTGWRFIEQLDIEELQSAQTARRVCCAARDGGAHEGGGHFAFADGHVQFLSENMDTATYELLDKRADGEVIGEF